MVVKKDAGSASPYINGEESNEESDEERSAGEINVARRTEGRMVEASINKTITSAAARRIPQRPERDRWPLPSISQSLLNSCFYPKSKPTAGVAFGGFGSLN